MPNQPEEIDLNDIRVFVEVVKAQSFTGAGRTLGMPRSTVSRRIAKLERRLGARLLHRTTRRLQLTDIGSSYYDQCAQSLDGIDEAEAHVRASHDTPRGRLRVTAPHDLGHHLAPVVKRFIERHPEVTIDVELSQRMVDLVGEGFDLALRAASHLPDSSLIARKIGGGDAVLYASPDYLEEHGTPKTIADLAHHDCLVLGSSHNHTWQLIKDDEEVTLPISGRVYVNDPAFVRSLATDGAGIGLIPDFLACELVATGRLVRVLPEYHALSAGLYVMYPSAKHLSATVRAFRDMLLEALSELPLEGHGRRLRASKKKSAESPKKRKRVSRARASSG
jgi:DNA-binding transcriptional LysR family regulator